MLKARVEGRGRREASVLLTLVGPASAPPPRGKPNVRKYKMMFSEMRGNNFETYQTSKIGEETT